MTEAFVKLILTFLYIKGGGMSSVTYCVCRGLHVCFIIVGKRAENLKKKKWKKSTVMLQRPIWISKTSLSNTEQKYNKILNVYVKNENDRKEENKG